MRYSLRWLAITLLTLASCHRPDPADDTDGLYSFWYWAGSKIKDKEALGGFAHSDNYPKPCADDGLGEPGVLSLLASPEETLLVRDRPGMRLRLINRTTKLQSFSACDSHLHIVREARTKEGDWKVIDSFPRPICGNSFHRVFLPANHYWSLAAPMSQGSCRTKLRFRLETDVAGGIPIGEQTYLSNEFDGEIDPARFKHADQDWH